MSSSSSQPSKALIPPTFDDDQQRQIFSFFVTTTCTVSTLYYRTDFWSYRTLQLSLTEPAIKYALCSLSALHNMFRAEHGKTSPSGRSAAEHKNYSLTQYNLAVKHTQELLARSGDGNAEVVIKGLVACILFICFENLMGNRNTAQMHLQNGLRIISRHTQSGKPKPNNASPGTCKVTVPDDIVQVLNRLDLQAMSFTGSREPYPYHLHQDKLEIDAIPPSPFTSIDEATDFLINTFRTTFRLVAASEPHPIPQAPLDFLATVLTSWSRSFTHLISTTKVQKAYPNSIILLKMYHTVLDIIISTRVYGFETLHDAQLPRYQYLVNLGLKLLDNENAADPVMSEDTIFSFEPGVIFALFFTAIKCRDPVLRRRAVELLGKNGHQEGAWESVGAARVAEFVIGVEEEGLLPGEIEGAGAEVVKEANRICLVNVHPVVDRRKIDVNYLMKSMDGDWVMREGTVVY